MPPPRSGAHTASHVLDVLKLAFRHPRQSLQRIRWHTVKRLLYLTLKQPHLLHQVTNQYANEFVREGASTQYNLSTFEESDLTTLDWMLPTSDDPIVSVIIPVHNQLTFTLNCLLSIIENPPDCPFEVILADDCSTDKTASVVQQVSNLIYLKNTTNLGFIRSCNSAANTARGKYLFFLNNDTLVTPGWLDTLLTIFHTHPDAGIVGSKLVFPDGFVQEFGGIVWRDGLGWNYGRGGDSSLPEYNYLKECDYVSGAALMIPRHLFESIGGFDDRYAPAYYEDTDIGFAVRAAKKKVYVQPLSVIVHFEGASSGTSVKKGIKQYQVVNRETFAQKWSEDLEAFHFAERNDLFCARDRSRNRMCVLVIDHYVPHFDQDAGSRSTYLYLKSLVTAGYNVKFLGDNFARHEPYTTALQQLGIEVLYGPYYKKHWRSWLKENAHYIDVAYLHRPHIAVNYIDAIRSANPKTKIIYFGHDLHYLRLKREGELTHDTKVFKQSRDWYDKEFAIFDKVDLVYYPSQIELDEIRKERPHLAMHAIPLYALNVEDDLRYTHQKRNGLLFVGGFNHPPNLDGMLWFLEDIFPMIQQRAPDMHLHIVGSNMPEEILKYQSEHIHAHGFVDDAVLENLYQGARLAIAPLRFGAGVKGKILEAMQMGVPVVTTSVGAEGIPNGNAAITIQDDSADFANGVLSLYNDQDACADIISKAQDTLQRYFNEDAVMEVIKRDFRPLP